MTEVLILSIGIILGCTISYAFIKVGIKSNYDAFNYLHSIDPSDDGIPSGNDEYDPEKDTSASEPQLDWDGYPYTEEYVSEDNSEPQIIGYIDPDKDEPN